MATVYDINVNALNIKIADELKKKPELKAPEFTKFIKTGVHKRSEEHTSELQSQR